MASLDWELTRRNGVTLVELVVTAEAEEWIRVDSRLEPVWPPRRQGVPAAGWDGTGFEGRVGPDDPLVLGYASPAAPVEPPARLETPVPDGSPSDGAAVSARALVRTLGESAPPRDVVPAAPPGGLSDSGDRRGPDRTSRPAPPSRPAAPGSGSPAEADPAAIEPWFDQVETRTAEAERLAEVTGADEAREAVETAGGIEAVRELRKRLAADRQRLRELGERQRQLADRLAAVEIPLSTLERVT